MHTIEREICAFIVRGGEYGDGEGTLIQTDWDYPGVARDLGWDMSDVQLTRRGKCQHSGTDGTINCPDCGVTAGEFICAAGEYLRSRCT